MAESIIQDRSKNEVIKAYYTPPKGKVIMSFLEHCIGDKKIFKFRYLRTTDGIKIYESIDKNFAGSGPVPETDLTPDLIP